MMGKVYFITRSFASDMNNETCGSIRNAEAELLRRRYDLVVVTPNHGKDEVEINSRIISLPFRNVRWNSYKERLGIYEDYLEEWIKETILCLGTRVTSEDVLVATCGGEAACMKIAYELKKSTGCKYVINFHDPLLYSLVGRKKIGWGIHASRERYLIRYVSAADYIITSSQSYQEELIRKIPEIRFRIKNVYFGYWKKWEKSIKTPDMDCLRLVYAGAMNRPQRPEQMISILGDLKGTCLELIGDVNGKVRRQADEKKNITIRPLMPHEEYMEYMANKADIGVVSLAGDAWGMCVPSKIFELINLQKPMLGILPKGDARDLINSGYGFAAGSDEPGKIADYVGKLRDPDVYETIREKMEDEKDQWKMDFLFREFYISIDELLEKHKNETL